MYKKTMIEKTCLIFYFSRQKLLCMKFQSLCPVNIAKKECVHGTLHNILCTGEHDVTNSVSEGRRIATNLQGCARQDMTSLCDQAEVLHSKLEDFFARGVVRTLVQQNV